MSVVPYVNVRYKKRLAIFTFPNRDVTNQFSLACAQIYRPRLYVGPHAKYWGSGEAGLTLEQNYTVCL